MPSHNSIIEILQVSVQNTGTNKTAGLAKI